MRQVPVFDAALPPIVWPSPLARQVRPFTLRVWHPAQPNGGDWR